MKELTEKEIDEDKGVRYQKEIAESRRDFEIALDQLEALVKNLGAKKKS